MLELNKVQSGAYVLNKSVKKNDALHRQDFRKARIAVIVAGRMKSSRLKKKGTLANRRDSVIREVPGELREDAVCG